jgi:TetR/AcrR family transcriptional regulator, transcriptional repressor for nem operon
MFKVERMRRSVVVEAAAAIRETGPDRVSASGLMGSAHPQPRRVQPAFRVEGRVAGGSRDLGFGEVTSGISRRIEGKATAEALEAVVGDYLSNDNLDHPERRYPTSTAASEVPRFSPATERFAEGIKRIPTRIEAWPGELRYADSHVEALSVAAEMVDATSLARARTDRSLSDEILAASRRSRKNRLSLRQAEAARQASHSRDGSGCRLTREAAL